MQFQLTFYLVDILLNAAGNAPIMKQRKWTVDWQKDINWVCKFIHKYLKLDSEEKLVSKNSEENKINDSWQFNFSSFTSINPLHRVPIKCLKISTNAMAIKIS